MKHSTETEEQLNNGIRPFEHEQGRELAHRSERPHYADYSSNSYGGDSDGGGKIDWQRFLGAVSRRRRVMAVIIGTVLALSFLYLAWVPRTYRTSAELLINTKSNDTGKLSDSIPALQGLVAATSTRDQDTEVQILASDLVRDAALQLLPEGERDNARDRTKVDITPKRDTDVIVVNVSGRDGKVLMRYANALCSAYLEQSRLNSTEQYRSSANYVRGQLEDVGARLAASRQALKDYKVKSGIVDMDVANTGAVAQLQRLVGALQDSQADERSSTASLASLKAQLPKLTEAEIQPSQIVVRPVVAQLKEQLTTLETQRLSTLQEYTPKSPEVVALDQQIAGIRRRLATEATTEVGTYTRVANPVRQQVLSDISTQQAALWSSQARIQALQSEIERVKTEIKGLPAREQRFSELLGDLQTLQQTYQNLNDKYQTLLISQSAPVSSGRVLSPAKDFFLVGPRKLQTLTTALFLGIFLSVGAAILLDIIDDRIYSEHDLTQITHLPILAHLPRVPSAQHKSLRSPDASTPLLESFRVLRTQLAFEAINGPLKCLIVSSSQPGEGKSMVAANLAVALALNGKRVILVDADLRRPTSHLIFDMGNENGVSTVVAGMCPLEDALKPTDVENLTLLPAGPTPPNPPELLDSNSMHELVNRLKGMCDHVILDSPPALMIADAQITATMADGVLLVVSSSEASRRALERAIDLLQHTGTRIIGIALNKFETSDGGYGYYGRYGYSVYLDNEVKLKEGSEGDETLATTK